jgi:uncharacterized protein
MTSATGACREKAAPPLDSIAPLSEAERCEALAFLAERPLHTVILAGWICDHGVISPHHRGTFYRTRDGHGRMSGVALIGRNTFFEARTGDALREFAKCARDAGEIKMVFAEERPLSEFWQLYSDRSRRPRLKSSEILFETKKCTLIDGPLPQLRLATPGELEPVARAHASMVRDETGIDPLVSDPEGFRSRCAQRIGHGRVWVWIKDGELLFKTDIISDTPAAYYIEGLWVNPSIRATGSSYRCLGSLCQRLLNGKNAIVGFVDADNEAAVKLYRNSGFSLRERYEKFYL